VIKPGFSMTSDFPAWFRAETASRSVRIFTALEQGLDRAGALARENVSGRVLQVRSGYLLRSIRVSQVERAGDEYRGRISSQPGPVNYGAALEYGFSVRAAVIRPRNGQALRFMGPAGPVFAAKVKRPAFTVSPRPWLRPAVSAAADRLEAWLSEAAGMTGG